MSNKEGGELSDEGALQNNFQDLSLHKYHHDSRNGFESPRPPQRASQELNSRELQELQGLETSGHELPQSKSKSTAPPSNHESYQIHNQFDPTPGNGLGLALPQFKSKRTPYASHLDSYQIHNLLNPSRGIRDELRRRGITPRNHHKANVAAIAMRSAKLHNIRHGLPVGDLPDGRPSRLRNSRNGLPEAFGRGERCETPDNASVTTATTQQSKGKKDSLRIDYMARNMNDLAIAAAAGRKKMSSSAPELQKPAHENYGRVPAYLSQRKLELAQDRERRVQEEKEKNLPPGLVLMKNDERLEVLKTLEDNRDKLVNKLSGMPLVVETVTQKRSKADIDTQLKEVEESIKRFSRPRVYIRYSN